MDGLIEIIAEAPVLSVTDSHLSPSAQSITPDGSPESKDSPKLEEASKLPEHIKDGKYYLDFVTLLVEDCVFMVPKHSFMRYEDQFNWMRDADEETVHELDGVEKADFRAFLKFVYPLYLPNQPPMTIDEWVSVLKLAFRWMMLDIREVAKKALNTRPWLQKIILARTFGIVTWVRDGYFDYVSRKESMSVEDVRGLGMETALKLIHIREKGLQHSRAAYHQESRSSSWYKLDSYQSVIDSCSSAVDRELFGELQGAQATRGVDAVERVLWARSRDDRRSLRLAYIELVERKESISMEDALKLGLETTVNLCRARENSLSTYLAFQGTPGRSMADIDSVFKEELIMVNDIGMMYTLPRGTPPKSGGKRSIAKKKKRS